MKVLVTNHSLAGLGGSETFSFSFIEELCRRGFEVDVYSPVRGFVAQKIQDITRANIVKKLSGTHTYDVIFSSHSNTLALILQEGVKGYKIHTCHGTKNILEKPIKGADKYVSVSKEVYDFVKKSGIESEIIYNGVDTKRFKPDSKLNSSIKAITCMCQGVQAQENTKKLCDELGAEYILLRGATSAWNVEDYINKSDLVVSLGRGAIEAMGCGRNVLVYDSRPYMESFCPGLITPDNVDKLKQCNFTGRIEKKVINDYTQLLDHVREYNPEFSDSLRDYCLENFNIEKQVDKYLNLIN